VIEPRVSVIMPVYDRDWCVTEAIESVLATGESGLELVLVDDGSRDGSRGIIEQYAKSNPHQVRVCEHSGKINRGIAASRNLGVAQSRGRYIAFLDSDDLFEPFRFRYALDWLDREPHFLAAIEPYRVANMNDATPVSREERRLTTLVPGDSANWLRAMLFANAYWSMPVITLRRGVFGCIGRFDERLRFAEETALWLKLASVGAVGVAQNEEAVACVRRHGRHSRDASDPLAELRTFLHVLLDVLDWTSRRHDVSDIARDVLGEKLRTYCIEILSDGALPTSFKAQAWLRSVLARPRLGLDRQVTGNLARALLRWQATGSR
jgi:glycosyltransferase involved in cell wall biosynthesis